MSLPRRPAERSPRRANAAEFAALCAILVVMGTLTAVAQPRRSAAEPGAGAEVAAGDVGIALACPPCDDGNACTTDFCNTATGTCQHRAVICDDATSCTQDSCDPASGCHFVPVSDGTVCDDGNACTSGERCQGGQCAGAALSCDDGSLCTQDYCDPAAGCQHQAVSCNDLNGCTIDACDPANGECRYDPLPLGAACDDQNACSVSDRCIQGGSPSGVRCVGTPTPGVACNDGDACTQGDTCQTTGMMGEATCQGNPISCNDGNACTQDACDSGTGQCQHTALNCDDGNVCTTDTCSASIGCQHANVPPGTACNDTNGCTTTDRCGTGAKGYDCYGTPTLGAVCNDGNPCSLNDQCVTDGRGGAFCNGTPLNCSDGNACTSESCTATGQCQVGTTQCNDGNPCTQDSCSAAAGGCQYVPATDGAVCDDQNVCTRSDQCQGGFCSGTPANCDDGNPCTNDFCSYVSGVCVHAPLDCNDGSACTIDSCNPATGLCQHAPIACSDGNTCTQDLCNPATIGCEFPVSPDGTACDDGNPCTQGDSCHSGQCSGGPVVCNDNNPCTIDSCNPASGACQFVPRPNGTLCSDGNACTQGDTCQAGQCTGAPIICDDGNSCTTDTCNPANGLCLFVVKPNGTACNDGSLCTLGDACQAGQCVGSAVPCSDGNACTTDSCDPATGQCRFTAIICQDANDCTQDSCDPAAGCRFAPVTDGSACDDHSTCTTGDLCVAGHCEGAVLNCDDGNPCTQDFCEPSAPGGCQHVPMVCDDQNACTTDSCVPATGQCQFAALPLGASCSDGNVCTVGDQCVQAPTPAGVQCSGTPTIGAACDDGDLCTQGDTCVNLGPMGQGTACLGAIVSCDDGNTCTSDLCDSATGACQHPPASCDDGNPCTTDSCAPATGCQHAPLAQGTACVDRDGPCTINDQCTSGPNGFNCYGTPALGTSCDDGSLCTLNDRCISSSPGKVFCAGTPIGCNSADLCTQGYCNGATGQCQFGPLSCDDGNACTLDACDSGSGGCASVPRPFNEVTPLAYSTQTKFTWPPTPLATHWNSYRGSIPATMLGSRPPGSIYDHTCFESGDAHLDGATTGIDAATPTTGRAFYYDLTEESGCGEGPLGKDSLGSVRPNASPCPTPP